MNWNHGEDPELTVAASGSPDIEIFFDSKGNVSMRLKSRHNINDIREWYCIDCKLPFPVKNSKDLDEVECPHCHGILPLRLLRNLALYESKDREKSF